MRPPAGGKPGAGRGGPVQTSADRRGNGRTAEVAEVAGMAGAGWLADAGGKP